MKETITVMKFTISEMIKRKSFVISTLIILVLIVLGFNVPNMVKNIKGEDSGDKILIVDNQNIFEGKLENLKDMGFEYDIEIGQENYEQIKQKIEENQIDSAIIIESNNNNYKIRYIVESKTMMDGVPEDIVNSINTLYSNIQIGKLGLTEAELQSITPNFEFSLEQTDEEEVKGNVLVMMIMSIVFFYAIYFCAYQVSSSITTEKTSRIMETLVTSTSPKTIIWGKTLGIGLVGLVQMILIIGTALFSAKMFLDEQLINSVLDMSNITISLGIITIIYFVLGYLAYSLLYALTGSTVSKPEDINSANAPIAILSVVGFYLSYFTMINPTSQLNVYASLLPISSPFCMPFRVMMGLASTKDIIMSILILIITILIIAKIAIKIYSSAILNYGTKLSFKNLFGIFKDKKN